MNLLTNNGLKIYNVSDGKSLPEWLSEKKKTELRKNEEFRSRIELIQDFSFDTSCQRVKFTPDGKYIMATGIYPPQVKVFELSELSNKFSRNLDCHVVNFEILSDDYSKPVFLRDDRYIEIHAKFGNYFKTRIPKLGRDLSYHKPSCDLYIGASGSDVYRLNLEEGRFLAPLETHLTEGVNVVAQNPVHQLMMFGGDNGVIECWDPRVKKMISSLNIAAALQRQGSEDDENGISITSGKFGPDGLTLGLGTSSGGVLLYDLRTAKPSMIKQHQYELPIKSINFHTASDGQQRLISADPKILKGFDKDTGKLSLTLEPKQPMNDVLMQDGSGLLMMPGNTSKIQTYYIPNLGAAPRWCSFLDNLTEELEEDKQLVYEDYKFITRDEVEKLKIENMIGTGYLRAYMHGFFIHIKLYNKVRSLNNPFEYEEYRANKIQEELKKASSSRISKAANANQKSPATQMKPKVNVNLSRRMEIINEIDKDETSLSKKERNAEISKNILTDSRFGKIFEEDKFEIDENSQEFKRINPRSKIKKFDEAILKHFDKTEDSDDGYDDDDDNDDNSQDDDDYEENNIYDDMVDSDQDDSAVQPIKKSKLQPNSNNNKKKAVKFYEIKQGHTLPTNINNSKSSQLLQSAPFSLRVQKDKKIKLNSATPDDNTKIKTADNGDLEISFTPSANKKKRPLPNKKGF
ncbi:NUC153 domain-containing protein [Tieghemostelium lacteum]|uniref:NUC153 domain-containing protein n=1 Tax=Tieghemostelium lacteum TaxID=361077 RepID=A0A151Z3B6_TIELA|nr:NUC153 domain-containing protein [Tieghemostelium lacteum]|eukprot:KYQ88456.1 NUC153 domain-containing protein [Tieghemostelium lacteum]